MMHRYAFLQYFAWTSVLLLNYILYNFQNKCFVFKLSCVLDFLKFLFNSSWNMHKHKQVFYIKNILYFRFLEINFFFSKFRPYRCIVHITSNGGLKNRWHYDNDISVCLHLLSWVFNYIYLGSSVLKCRYIPTQL